MSASCRSSHGAHASISSGCGSRLPGGRHFTTLAMYTSSRVRPMPSISCVSSLPARPDERLALQVLLLARAFADEQQIRVGSTDTEHHLGAPRRELAELAARSDRRAPRRASRPPPCADAGMRRTSRATPHSPAEDRLVWSIPPDATGEAARIASATTSAADDAEAVEVCFDHAGRDRDRDVAVETRVRGPQRHARIRRARSARRGGTPACRSTASVTTTTSVVLAPDPPRRARRPGIRARRRGAVEPATTVPSSADHVTDGVDHRERDHVARRRNARPPRRTRRRPRARGRATSRPSRPVPAPTRPSGVVGAPRPPRPPRSPSSGPGWRPPDSDEVEHARGRARSAPVRPPSEIPARVRRGTASRRRRRRARTPIRPTRPPRRPGHRARPARATASSRVAGAPPRTSPTRPIPSGSEHDRHARCPSRSSGRRARPQSGS